MIGKKIALKMKISYKVNDSNVKNNSYFKIYFSFHVKNLYLVFLKIIENYQIYFEKKTIKI